MRRIDYIRGKKVGEGIYLSELNPHVTEKGNKFRKALFECPHCGARFKGLISDVKSLRTKCVCRNQNITHCSSKHKHYKMWLGIMQRCYNKKSDAYYNYGAIGIGVYKDWWDDPAKFYHYIQGLPDYDVPGYTIDRKENSKGYFPGNLRWVSRHIQNTNQRIRSNKSGYTGVFISNPNGRCVSYITVNRKRKTFGHFYDIIDAVKARDQYIIDNKLFEYKLQILNQNGSKHN